MLIRSSALLRDAALSQAVLDPTGDVEAPTEQLPVPDHIGASNTLVAWELSSLPVSSFRPVNAASATFPADLLLCPGDRLR